MNIFYLDEDVVECAKAHCNSHCIKMILEYARILSTAHRVIDGIKEVSQTAVGRKKTLYRMPDDKTDDLLYSATHVNHPSAVWARESVANYIYLYELFSALSDEYTFRYGKVHKSFSTLKDVLSSAPSNLDADDEFIPPPKAMKADVESLKIESSLLAYRSYYRFKICNGMKMQWKNRPVPKWI